MELHHPRPVPRWNLVPLAAALTTLAIACSAPARAVHPEPPPGAASAAAVTPLAIPAAIPDGPAIQVAALADTPGLKVMAIRLRGVELPPHRSEFPVVIAAVAGSGTVVLGDQRVPVDAGHSVALAPRVEHAVVPDPGDDLVLLVTHARGAR